MSLFWPEGSSIVLTSFLFGIFFPLFRFWDLENLQISDCDYVGFQGLEASIKFIMLFILFNEHLFYWLFACLLKIIDFLQLNCDGGWS